MDRPGFAAEKPWGEEILEGEELHRFAQWLAGRFTNAQQVADYPGRYGLIELVFRPLPHRLGGAIAFYGEQAYGYALDRPYRQVVHRIVGRWGTDREPYLPKGEGLPLGEGLPRGEDLPRGKELEIWVENYRLVDAQAYVGAAQDQQRLGTIALDQLRYREGCSMVFRSQGDSFVGQLAQPRCCQVPWEGRETYLVCEAILTENHWTSRDRGFDVQTHEQIWGSLEGPLQFRKGTNFAPEVL